MSGNVKCKLAISETQRQVTYSLYIGGLRALYGEVNKNPGWKQAWAGIRKVLEELVEEIESGTGLQSRAFQRSPSTMGVYSAPESTSK